MYPKDTHRGCNNRRHDFSIVRDKDLCINCKVCVRQCSYEAHYWDEARQKVMADNAKCVGCHRCEALCPTSAILIQKKHSDFKDNALWRPEFIKYIYKQADTGGVLLTGMAAGLFAGITALQYVNAPQVWLVLGALIITLVLCYLLKLNYALGAIVALIHDVLTTVGIFSILNKEFDLTIIAALLTLIGYSLNDTIIVYDRIRETRRLEPDHHLPTVINHSVNQTLSRTVLTSGLAFLAVFSLYLFGGEVIHDFALAMLIGIIVGTYSSIYVAAPIIVSLTPEDAYTPPPAPTKASAKPRGGVKPLEV